MAADHPNLLNIYWVRTGGDLAGPQHLGLFSVRSVFGLVAQESYTSDATHSQGPPAGTAVAGIGTTYVPQQTGGVVFQISEPGTLMLLSTGLLSLARLRRRRP